MRMEMGRWILKAGFYRVIFVQNAWVHIILIYVFDSVKKIDNYYAVEFL